MRGMERLLCMAVAWFHKWEWRLAAAAATLMLLSFAVLAWRFIRAETVLVPRSGGTYIEASVGDLQPLIPWFTLENDVNRDIVTLVFSGLLRFNPQSKRIEEDLARMRVSSDGRIYTLQLKEGLQWHDATERDPHPVTADDIVFTFKTVQDPAFGNALLRQNFHGVRIEKVDDRTVQFRLDRPYSFFPSNLTLGLVPQRAFAGVPIGRLQEATDFGFAPIGAGPYRFRSVVQTNLSTEVTLERFSRPIPPQFRLDRVVMRIFPDFTLLLSDSRNVDGIRLAPTSSTGEPVVPPGFSAVQYSLPQYVALFLNLDRAVLQDQKLRLGLQLGTDKRSLLDTAGQATIMDTPLLELAAADWRYAFDPAAAQGALFSSQWYFPEKVRLQRLLEQREANGVGALQTDAVVLLDTGATLAVTGAITGVPKGATLQSIHLVPDATASGTWVVHLGTDGGTGSLRTGENLLRLTDAKGRTVDSFYLWRTTDPKAFRRAAEEQRLVDRFLASRDGRDDVVERLDVSGLFLEGGFLRARRDGDPVDVRVNDHGESLRLTLLTSPTPPAYQDVAQHIAKQWRPLGVLVDVIVPETRAQFEERLLKRDYDVLLFGQSLLDTLDSYPYWHSSGVQRLTGNRRDLRIDAYNLSQYASFEADALLEAIRSTNDERERALSLKRLQEVFKRDVPAIILYSPLYTFAHKDTVRGMDLGALAQHSDRFLGLEHWYVKQERVLKPGKSPFSFFPWLFAIGQEIDASSASP